MKLTVFLIIFIMNMTILHHIFIKIKKKNIEILVMIKDYLKLLNFINNIEDGLKKVNGKQKKVRKTESKLSTNFYHPLI